MMNGNITDKVSVKRAFKFQLDFESLCFHLMQEDGSLILAGLQQVQSSAGATLMLNIYRLYRAPGPFKKTTKRHIIVYV